MLKNAALRECALDLTATGDLWREFAVQGALLVKQRRDGSEAYAHLAALLRECGAREQEIFTRLKTAV